jgi:heptosyltransferase II
MALPAIERLRESRPAARITLLTAGKLADLFTHHPAIDQVIPFDKIEGTLTLARRLRGSFDLALILPNSFRSAAEVWLARIPQRVGYGGNGRTLLLTKRVLRRATECKMHKRSDAEVRRLIEENRSRETFPATAHHIYNYLHLVSAIGASSTPVAPRIPITAAETSAFRAKFSIPDNKPLFGLNPGAEYGPAKRWPVENFIETARLVSAQRDCGWLIFGGQGDRETIHAIQQSLPGAINLAGATTLRELCAGLSICQSVITNDTGPMHLAAAVGARVVVPFGSTSSELTGPGLPESTLHKLVLGSAQCAPCFRRTCPIDFRCMRSITPKMVADAVLSP